MQIPWVLSYYICYLSVILSCKNASIWINWTWYIKNIQSWLLRSADRRKHSVLELYGVLGQNEPKQRLRRNSEYLPQQLMLTLHWNEVRKLLPKGFVGWAHFNGHNVLKQSIMITKAALGFVLLQNTHKHTHTHSYTERCSSRVPTRSINTIHSIQKLSVISYSY